MKHLTWVAVAATLLATTSVTAGNLSDPIIEQEPVATRDASPSGDEALVARDAVVAETAALADGSILVPVLFFVYGAAVLTGG